MKTQFTGFWWYECKLQYQPWPIMFAIPRKNSGRLSPQLILLRRQISPSLSLATQHTQRTRLLSQSRHAALGWQGMCRTHVYACETSEAEQMRRTVLSEVKCEDKRRIWYTLTHTSVHCDRKAVWKKRCKIEKANFNWKGFVRILCTWQRRPGQQLTHTQPRVCERGGIIGNIIDTSRPLTHTEALQKQALDTLTQLSQPTRTHLRCCTSLFNLVLDNGHCGGNCFVYISSFSPQLYQHKLHYVKE